MVVLETQRFNGEKNRIAPNIATRQIAEVVCVVHRVGQKEDNKNRHVVVFALRHVQEELWCWNKDSLLCREIGNLSTEILLLEMER